MQLKKSRTRPLDKGLILMITQPLPTKIVRSVVNKVKLVFENQTLTCAAGSNLGDVLMKHSLSPYPEDEREKACKGYGICATCKVMVSGAVNPPTAIEFKRLCADGQSLPSGLRLACRVVLHGDSKVHRMAYSRD
jgi:ferredoxin